MYYEHIASFIDLCSYLWPEMPGIAPQYVVLEMLRIAGLIVGTAVGVAVIAVVVHDRIMKKCP